MNNLYQIVPQNLELEQSILNDCLYKPSEIVFDILDSSDFYKTAHQKIFSAIKELYNNREPIDIIAVKTLLSDKQQIEEVGGAIYLGQLLEIPLPTNTEYSANKLKKYSQLRRLIKIGNATSKRAFQGDTNEVENIIDYIQNEILNLGISRIGDWKPIGDIVVDCIDHIEKISERGGITGIPSGFTDLDVVTCGFQPGDLILLAGRPSMGKTAFVDCCVVNAAKEGFKSGICSLEMANIQIGTRFISSESKINSMRFRSGKFDNDHWKTIHNVGARISKLPIWIDDTPRASYQDIQRKARYAKKNFGIDSLWIDYLGFIDGDKENGRVMEIQSISRGLKALAKELFIPIILVCQLSRECEKRPNKRPILSDLRESGALEQDADVVCFLYRDEVYNKDDKQNKGIAELNIAKQRSGPTDMINLAWIESTTRFENLIRNV